ncbi:MULTISPECIES: class I SAM-dependent methyltransferase [Hyphobacterium]|uniref:Class I SAM-dependent methyltransferase n=1 Tax=Hyphobacterium vulgare TaxID=1736751 RepID=A0ABV6ZYS9_9PROT
MILKHGETPAAFIARVTGILSPPLLPELRFHLAEETVALWNQTEEALQEQGLPPPFWAFAWAGGQALGRYCFDRPEIVAGKRVLDFAAGGGMAGIAAARAGASTVTASEIDAFAIEACRLNAALNDCAVETVLGDVTQLDRHWDVILAGDVFYEKGPAERIDRWLSTQHTRGATVLIGDPGRSFLPTGRLEKLAEYDVPVTRDLEDREIRHAKVWRYFA